MVFKFVRKHPDLFIRRIDNNPRYVRWNKNALLLPISRLKLHSPSTVVKPVKIFKKPPEQLLLRNTAKIKIFESELYCI